MRADRPHAAQPAHAAPADPIAAATHAAPYPYYAELVATRPFYRDEALGLWVASSAEAVRAVLSSGLCGVRPTAEPVPKTLLGSPAADIFRHLVRMSDGPGHGPCKRAVSATLESIDEPRAARHGQEWARRLWHPIAPAPAGPPGRITEFAFQLPVHVVASLLGVPRHQLRETAGWMSDFVSCLSPAASAEQVDRGKQASGHLLARFRSLLAARTAGETGSLLAALARQAQRAGAGEPEAVVANAIGFMFQAHDATAGLIGNALLILAAHREVREQVKADSGLLGRVVEEVLRYDSPVQNTRRFLAGCGRIAGHEMRPGDVVLVVLAAANRDPAANPHPDRFDLYRRDRQIFSFGANRHACPGAALAATIARAGIEQLLLAGVDPEQLGGAVTYRPFPSVRIPILPGGRHHAAGGAVGLGSQQPQPWLEGAGLRRDQPPD